MGRGFKSHPPYRVRPAIRDLTRGFVPVSPSASYGERFQDPAVGHLASALNALGIDPEHHAAHGRPARRHETLWNTIPSPIMIQIMTRPEIRLRQLQPADIEAVHSWAGLPEVCRYQAWGPNSLPQTRAFVEEAAAAWHVEPQTRFTYAALLHNEVIGMGEFHIRNVTHAQGPPSLGQWPGHRHRPATTAHRFPPTRHAPRLRHLRPPKHRLRGRPEQTRDDV
ncbi:hypothetical protein Misp03_31060 [Microbispora sp. NBRC 16548]|nr:hypothetical protein Misp03_31060 [Microbispora sp. NBRC 16548]